MAASAVARPVEDGPRAPAERPGGALVAAALVAVPAVLLAAVALARWRNGFGNIDLAILDQSLWSASKGRDLFSSVLRENLLGDHFEPGMLAFLPLYRLRPTAAWLLVGQVTAATSAVVMIANRLQLALDRTRRAALAGALLLSPPVAFALVFDVHALVFAGPFAVGAVFAAADDRPGRAAVLGLLAAMFRLEAGMAVAVALAVLSVGRPRRRALLLPLGVACGYLTAAVLLEGRLAAGDNHWTGHFGHLGSSPADALSHPWRVVAALVSVGSLAKALPWVLSSGLLCLRRPRWMLPAAVAALPVLLSEWPGTSSWAFHYGYLPSLLLALAWVPVVATRPERWRWVAGGCLALNLLASPLIPSVGVSMAGPRFAAPIWTRAADHDLRAVVAGVPPGAVVSGPPRALALLSHRAALFLWPYPFAPAGPDTLPNPQLQRADASLASTVDVVVVGRADQASVPPGFVLDRSTPTWARFRRVPPTG